MNRIFKMLAFTAPLMLAQTGNANDTTAQMQTYLKNFEGESGFEPLVKGMVFEYERLQHFKKTEPQYDWAVAVAIEPSGRYSVGFGKDIPTGPSPAKHAKRFCNEQRKMRSVKAKCRTLAINAKVHKPYKR